MSELVRFDAEEAGKSARDRVLRLVRLLQADRSGWKPTPVMLDLWVDEFGRKDASGLLEAGRKFLRSSDGLPSIHGIHEALASIAEANRHPEYEPLPPIEDVAGTGSAQTAQRKHPWYEPGLSLEENQARCKSWRRSQEARGLGGYDNAGRWSDYAR